MNPCPGRMGPPFNMVTGWRGRGPGCLTDGGGLAYERHSVLLCQFSTTPAVPCFFVRLFFKAQLQKEVCFPR